MGRASEGGEDVEALGGERSHLEGKGPLDTERDVGERWRARLEGNVISAMTRTSRGYLLLVAGLLAVVAWGIYAYTVQFRNGLVVTGLRDRIMWGFYISNFIFVIGISYGGTLISAVLRITGAEWRRPITRIAEGIAVAALAVGALFPIIDLGRPDRILFVFVHGRWQSPIIWDVMAITTYMVATLLYLFLLMIPDMGLFRDHSAQEISPWRHALYRVLSFGWVGSQRQRRLLSRAGMMMAIAIIPIAVTVHTVLAWLFSMNLRENWNSTIFGPFFVAGAIYSGIATVIVVMAVMRKVYHLEEYIKERHFIYLGYFLGTFTLVMIYANVAEFLTVGYSMAGQATFHLDQLFKGQFAPFFWFVMLGGLAIPGLLILMPWTRNIWGIVAASVLVIAALGAERYYLIVSALRVPQMPYEASVYAPTWVELSVTMGAFALVGLLLALFVKLFPILPVWEMSESPEEAEEAIISEPSGPLPAPGAAGAGAR
jgi:Ni/Fe-hydrogenase subunit HybB-like protein